MGSSGYSETSDVQRLFVVFRTHVQHTLANKSLRDLCFVQIIAVVEYLTPTDVYRGMGWLNLGCISACNFPSWYVRPQTCFVINLQCSRQPESNINLLQVNYRNKTGVSMSIHVIVLHSARQSDGFRLICVTLLLRHLDGPDCYAATLSPRSDAPCHK